MDENHNGFDQPAEPVGPEIDDSGNPTEPAPDQGERPKAPAGREMLTQLQQMIDTVAYQAAPVVREVAAKAAELAAVAGQKAGPLAHKAADVTEHFGQRVAARSSAVAADLRRPRDETEPVADDGATNSTADAASSWDSGQSESNESGSGESTDQS